jgi:hypothetical protein
VDLTGTGLGAATMREVAGLVAGLERGGVEHVCLNKTGLERVQGGLGQLLAALQGAGPASEGAASSDEEQWPLLELSEVRVPARTCGGGLPCLTGEGLRGSETDVQQLVQQRCNNCATGVQQRCNRGATAVQQRRNRGGMLAASQHTRAPTACCV